MRFQPLLIALSTALFTGGPLLAQQTPPAATPPASAPAQPDSQVQAYKEQVDALKAEITMMKAAYKELQQQLQSVPQSLAEARQEIDRLKQSEKQKQADLDAARAQIAELEARLKQAGSGAGGGAIAVRGAAPAGGAPATAENPDALVPADPNLGPGGLLSALQAEYLANFDSAPPPPTNPKQQQEFDNHLRRLEPWCVKVNRDWIRNLTWVGRIDPASVHVNGRLVSLVLLFKNGLREFRVPITVDQGALSRVRKGDLMDFGDLAVTGVVRPRIRVTPARAEPGAFENTPLVAPYVEFGFDYDLKSIIPAEKMKQGGAKPASGS